MEETTRAVRASSKAPSERPRGYQQGHKRVPREYQESTERAPREYQHCRAVGSTAASEEGHFFADERGHTRVHAADEPHDAGGNDEGCDASLEQRDLQQVHLEIEEHREDDRAEHRRERACSER